jgi:flagellar hook-associated protein FlgK
VSPPLNLYDIQQHQPLPNKPSQLSQEVFSLEKELMDLNLRYKTLVSQQSDLLASGVHDMQQVNSMLRQISQALNEKSEKLF